MENKGLIIGIAAVAVIGIAIFAFGSKQNTNQATTGMQATPMMQQTTDATTAQTMPADSGTGMEATSGEAMEAGSYKDGTYTASGTYTSPAGQEEVEVTVTLKGGMVEDAQFTGKAVNPKSVAMQGMFKENFQPMVVGKSIDEVNLTKVSGSSLTSGGFNAAIEKIKEEAKG